ncbi:SIS domain-containing protein [Microbacterium luteolum]|jgi:uncharacterized phosphosugar-binding protein|uniref:SIS domain-containing protein n=1 Tax=Microbacterium luteolum TaxID=69367 RepID=A0ABY7XUP8_MICLT|nr:SIS domain-containing protein [Microbacterium luteolum]WDM44465.1 SIS domain-containing protein [Microbacterium luteolum]
MMIDTTTNLTTSSSDYLDGVTELLAEVISNEKPAIAAAGRLVADRFENDGLLYVFGSGHSHVFAEEAFYRAGGAARICPVLVPEYMLHVSAEHSTTLERESGHVSQILSAYELNPERDVFLVVSNSGANALPVEMAQTAKDQGVPVIAITSRAYANASTNPGRRLHDVADIVIDNHCPPGDATITIADDLPKVGPASSSIGLALMNALLVEALALQVERGDNPDVWVSAGMPNGRAHNVELANRFRSRIPHI